MSICTSGASISYSAPKTNAAFARSRPDREPGLLSTILISSSLLNTLSSAYSRSSARVQMITKSLTLSLTGFVEMNKVCIVVAS